MKVDEEKCEIADLEALLEGLSKLASYEGIGLTSKKNVKVDLYHALLRAVAYCFCLTLPAAPFKYGPTPHQWSTQCATWCWVVARLEFV